ncbi:hypothetical protein KC644_04100 [Candidatus Berkelbacteria bacterium]|nr:hypothetical protein [Candidatus Berkelbacteria bacterium]
MTKRLIGFTAMALLIGIGAYYALNQNSEASPRIESNQTSLVGEVPTGIPSFAGELIQGVLNQSNYPYFISWQTEVSLGQAANQYYQQLKTANWKVTDLAEENGYFSFQASNDTYEASVFVVKEQSVNTVSLTVYPSL